MSIKRPPSWNGRHLGRERPKKLNLYWTVGLGLVNKFSKFGPNRIKILAQIEKSFCGGEGRGRVGGGSKYFLKIPYVIVNKMTKFGENRICRFFLNLRGAKFPFFSPGAALGAVSRFC
jgi:hypothetical protein